MVEQVLVDLEGLAVLAERRRVCPGPCRPRPGPCRPRRLGTVVPPAKHDQVRHHLGTRGFEERSGRKADGADQVGQGVHLPAGRRVAGVERVARGQDGDEPAGARQVKALQDEVVVQGVARAVVPWVVRGHLGEGHVADDEVEVAVRNEEALEPAVVDLGRCAVEVSGHRRRRGVGLDAGDVATIRGQADEVPRAASRFEDPAAVEAQLTDGTPHRRDHLRAEV